MLRKFFSIIVFSLLIVFNISSAQALSSSLTNTISRLINSGNLFVTEPDTGPETSSIQPHFNEVFIGSLSDGVFLGKDAPFGIITSRDIGFGIENTAGPLGLFSGTSALSGIYIDDAAIGILGSSSSGSGISVLSSKQIGVLTKGEIGLISLGKGSLGSFGVYSLGISAGIVSNSSNLGSLGISNGIGGVKGVREKAGVLHVGILGTEQYGASVYGSAYVSGYNHTLNIQETAYFGS